MSIVLPPAAGIAKVTAHTSFGGYNAANIFHVYAGDTTHPISLPDLTLIATKIRASYKARFLPLLANGLTLNNVDAQDLTTTTGLVYTATGSDGGGDISSGNATNQVACCVTWHIGRHYRGGRPRTYLWGFKQDVFADTRNFNSTFLTSLATAANAFIADALAMGLSTGSSALVCLHYYQGGGSTTKPPTPLTTPIWDQITSASVNSRIDTQRRRLGK